MNPYHQNRLRSSPDDDLDHLGNYHQDYREGIRKPYTSPEFFIPAILCCIPVIYHICYYLDYDLLPLPQLLWNVLVYFTPSRLIDVVENITNTPRFTDPGLKGIPKTHAAKSEAMRRILGIDTPGGIMGSVAQVGRRFSHIPGINLTPQASGNEKPAGLGNYDNSCYQNSVLQGLASLDSLSEYLTNPTLEAKVIDGSQKPDMKMAEALRSLIETLHDSENNGKRIWTPATLKNMSSWQQQDAQEYYSKVLDEIDKEVGKFAATVRSSQGFESNERDLERPSKTLFRNPLEGLIAQRVGCTRCGYSEGLSMIPFNCLTVPLTRAWEHQISDCLDEYTKLEQIDGVECGKCTLLKYHKLFSTLAERTKNDPTNKAHLDANERLHSITEALEEDEYDEKTIVQKCKIPLKNRVLSTKSRQAVIARPPKSLVVHFNRSLFDEHTGELRKNTSQVRFPKVLDLGPWCLGSSGTVEDSTTEEWCLDPDSPMVASTRRVSAQHGPYYELRAVVTHVGRHENGHYVCYRKHAVKEVGVSKTKQWWRLSDDEVSKSTEDIVVGQGGVFMLFYDQITPAVFASRSRLVGGDGVVESKVTDTPNSTTSQPFNASEGPVEVIALPELAVAASVALPDLEDDGLSEYEDLLTTNDHQTTTTTPSDGDDGESTETESNREEQYRPTEPIIVSSYILHAGEGETDPIRSERQNSLNPGNMVMV